MKYILACAVLIGALFLTGCANYGAPLIPPMGLIYEDVKAPMDVDFDKTTLGSKQGTAESMSILGLIALGDCSINTAADNGNIMSVTHADYQYFNVLGVYQKFTTIAYGD